MHLMPWGRGSYTLSKEALGKEVAAIWERFRNDVEKAQVKSAVIRATHYESRGCSVAAADLDSYT